MVFAWLARRFSAPPMTYGEAHRVRAFLRALEAAGGLATPEQPILSRFAEEAAEARRRGLVYRESWTFAVAITDDGRDFLWR